MSPKLRAIPLAALTALAVAACGSSGSTTPTRAELVAKADPICKQIAVRRAAANKQLSKDGSNSTKGLQVLARVAPGVAAYEHQAVAQLRGLTAPASLTSDWQQMLSGMQTLADDAAQIGVDAEAKQLKKTESINSRGRTSPQRHTTI